MSWRTDDLGAPLWELTRAFCAREVLPNAQPTPSTLPDTVRMYRDDRVQKIYTGANEVMKELVA